MLRRNGCNWGLAGKSYKAFQGLPCSSGVYACCQLGTNHSARLASDSMPKSTSSSGSLFSPSHLALSPFFIPLCLTQFHSTKNQYNLPLGIPSQPSELIIKQWVAGRSKYSPSPSVTPSPIRLSIIISTQQRCISISSIFSNSSSLTYLLAHT